MYLQFFFSKDNFLLTCHNAHVSPTLKTSSSHGHRQQCGSYQREGGWGLIKGKGVKYIETKEDLTLGAGHTMQRHEIL